MYHPKDITEYFINNFIQEGDTVVDATAGNGYDTLKLCKKTGENGKVFAFDIQECALAATDKRLKEAGLSNAVLILDSHSEMDKYVSTAPSAVIFNLGYLPGGNHEICTHAASSVAAIEKALAILSENGFISITIYYGKNSGTDEKEAVMQYLKSIDSKKYTVMVYDFYNRPNCPPITVIITPC